MKPFRGWLGALLALVSATPVIATDTSFLYAVRAEQARAKAPRFERADFLVQPAIAHAVLSPDGTRVGFLRGTDERPGLWLRGPDGMERQLLASSDATDLAWTRDGQWLLVVSPSRLFAIAVADGHASRLLTPLGGSDKRTFMGVDPSRAASVIVRVREGRLLRIDIGMGERVVADLPQRIDGYAFDGQGHLSFLQAVQGDASVIWRIGPHADRRAVLRCAAMHRCALWPLTDDQGRALLLGDVGGSRRTLQRLENDGHVVNLLDDPQPDGELDDVAENPASGLPLAARFAGTTVHHLGIDAPAQRHIAAIERRYPARALLLQPGRFRWLVTERGGALHGPRYHLYDPASGRFDDILDDAPRRARGGGAANWLPERAMARQIPFSWTASDGMRLHGFVRVPPGADPARVPLVAMIHGGPWANVAAEEFGSGYAQFLVNRGYAVFEPNFRGSTGFGRDYMLAAAGDFGNGRVQADVVEGVRALLGAGVGDPERVGIVGASFGGYTTLLALTWQPELFRVGVALVPPPDFAWDLTWIARSREAEVLSRKLPFERWMSLMGLDLADKARMDRLHGQSPLANPERVTRPLTIVAGGEDQRVALRGVLGYAATMKLAGKDVTLIVDPAAGHAGESAVAHEAVMYILGDTLHRYLGGDAETPPDAALRDYLMRNLRFGGEAYTRRI